MKTVNRISSHFPTVRTIVRVPVFHHLTRVPTFCIADGGSYIKILEQSKGSADRYFMLHTILPVLYQVGFKQQIIFCLDAISQTARIPY